MERILAQFAIQLISKPITLVSVILSDMKKFRIYKRRRLRSIASRQDDKQTRVEISSNAVVVRQLAEPRQHCAVAELRDHEASLFVARIVLRSSGTSPGHRVSPRQRRGSDVECDQDPPVKMFPSPEFQVLRVRVLVWITTRKI